MYISFSIFTNPYFRINGTTGDIYTTGVPIDREVYPQYNITVGVNDDNSQTDVALFSICVCDLNDNRPVFTSESVGFYQATINEDLVANGQPFYQSIEATDRDEKEIDNIQCMCPATHGNARLTYSITGGDTRFQINPYNGLFNNVLLLSYTKLPLAHRPYHL